MWLNYKIFGWNRFISTDSRLFSSETVSSGSERIIQFREVEEHFVEGRLASVYVCISTPNFAQGCTCPGNEGDFSTCSCTIRDCCWITNCDLLTFGDISSFPPVFPPGGGGTGSGGSGGGGSPPSPFPCPSLQGRAAAPPPGCGSTGNPPIYPAPPINILAMLTEYTTAINSASEIMVVQANNEHVEYGQAIVRHKTNSTIYTKNKRTDNQPNYVEIVHYVTANEVLIGEEHVHEDFPNKTNPLDRSAPSMSDIFALSKNRAIPNFVSFINCGNVRYALVIENLAVFAQFYRNNFRQVDELDKQQNTIAGQQPNWNSNWQLATEIALLQLLGANSGVAIYKSNNTEKTNFIKLN